jgi:hypothetical protein
MEQTFLCPSLSLERSVNSKSAIPRRDARTTIGDCVERTEGLVCEDSFDEDTGVDGEGFDRYNQYAKTYPTVQ